MLGIVSYLFPEGGVIFGKQRFYFPSLEDILLKNREKGKDISLEMRKMEESLRMRQYQDSLSFFTGFFQTHPSRIHFPEGNPACWDSLFESLASCQERNELVHILHYGDSQIEGDRITGYIRQQLQEKFGGAGPGLIPAVQPVPSSSISQKASENLERYIVSGNFTNQVQHKRYGVLGQMAYVPGSGTVSVASRNWKTTFDNVKKFSKIRMYVGNTPANFRASLLSADATRMHKLDRKKQEMSVIRWEMPDPVQKFTLKLSGSAEVYGIALDGGCGVAVDNIPLRGSSGTFFTSMDTTVMKPMLKDLNVGLIILEFGGNMMPSIRKEKGVEDYKVKMAKQIAYFQRICPEAKILLIGPSDMSTKINGKLQTYPLLEQVVQGMKEAALESGAAFWDMYKVMGGENSMISWVRNKPSLAAPDYIHFTSKGAERIAELFYESLMIYYDYYNFRKEYKLNNPAAQ
ncbi:MAG: GDSL-type esterase/lipase family protein [Candidatus Symbiothrix sp.]|nr:GDSL-type esterase/lipase family protein [Candidatus Symbiothrix sp.]